MTDFKNDTNKAMLKAWNTVFKSSLKEFTYNRDNESYTDNPNNENTGTEPYYDAVNEVWVYPDATTPDNTEVVLKGLKRDVKKDAGKDPTLYVTDIKLTVRASDFDAVFTAPPRTSDTVDYAGTNYRVLKYDEDSVDCFYHIFLRGV